MRKNFVIDTSVLIHDYKAISVFKENTVIIPIAVLEELDHLKSRPDSAGANARLSIRKIDEFCQDKDITQGVDIGDGITLIIDVLHNKDKKFSAGGKDDAILACAAAYENSILVSKDINMRLRAKAFGINAEDYTNDKLDIEDLYIGYRKMNVEEIGSEILMKLNGGLNSVIGTPFEKLYPNEFVILDANGKERVYRRHSDDSLRILRVPNDVYGIKSRNREQAMTLDLLLDPTVHLVSLFGTAGGGKTVLSCAAALYQCLEIKSYSKVEFYKSISSVGQELGYFPGLLTEKLLPHYGSIIGAIETLNKNTSFDEFMDLYKNKIKIEAISLLRGRTINGFTYFDEVQNNSKSEIKTIITRAGNDCKVVLSGDISQIDNSYLNFSNNALTHVIETFKGSRLAGVVKLTKGERSALATEASQIL